MFNAESNSLSNQRKMVNQRSPKKNLTKIQRRNLKRTQKSLMRNPKNLRVKTTIMKKMITIPMAKKQVTMKLATKILSKAIKSLKNSIPPNQSSIMINTSHAASYSSFTRVT